VSNFTKPGSELIRKASEGLSRAAREVGKTASSAGLASPGRTLAGVGEAQGWSPDALLDAADAELVGPELGLSSSEISATDSDFLSFDELWAGWFGECETYEHEWDPTCFDGVGDPVADAGLWRLQEGPSCAVNAQLCVVESLTGECIDQDDVCPDLEERGCYSPWSGTALEDMDVVLTDHGLETDCRSDATVNDLAEALHRGDGVVVALNAQEIWEPLRDVTTGEVVAQPGNYGHAVQITGIDRDADGGYSVIMNDTGRPDGAMRAVALEDFVEAWGDYDNYVVTARNPATV
jgi:hypothetical protein